MDDKILKEIEDFFGVKGRAAVIERSQAVARAAYRSLHPSHPKKVKKKSAIILTFNPRDNPRKD